MGKGANSGSKVGKGTCRNLRDNEYHSEIDVNDFPQAAPEAVKKESAASLLRKFIEGTGEDQIALKGTLVEGDHDADSDD